jgi:hypothetical protein
MAYKDVLVYLDPSAEAIKRLRFAADLANAHGARLIAVDASAPAVAEGSTLCPRRAGCSTTRREEPD